MPAERVHPAVVAVMAEIGIDISAERPKGITEQAVREADVVVTMGCGDACPVFSGKRYLDWELVDPGERTVEAIRPIRDEIARRVLALMDDLLSG
jgi:protein-tyrosine-phosphatase